MTKLSDEQIEANAEAVERWCSIRSISSIRTLSDFFHCAGEYGFDPEKFIAEVRALYKAETTPVKKMVTREVGGTSSRISPITDWVYLDKPIPPNTKVRVIYEVKEDAE